GRAALHRQHLSIYPGRVGGVRLARPHAVGRGVPADARHGDGHAPGADHVDEERLDHVRAGDLCARRRPHRPRAGTRVRASGRDREELQGDRRGQARRPPRAGVLHGGRHRRGDGEGQEAARGGVVADRLRLEVVTPTRLVVAETVDEVVVPGSDGYFGVLPGHAAFLTTLGTGEVIYRIDRDEFYLAVSGGFAEVRNDKVIVLADAAE